jgi:hypothetical protein
MAYLEPLRVSIVGDKIAGARYIRDARRIAFGLLRQLREGGVLSGRRLYKNDATGVTIEVVVAGAIVAATIYTAGGGRFTQFPQGFVVWPRDGNHVDGIDEEFPQLLLEPPDEEADDPAWATLFKSAAIDGFQEFSYQKGVYGAHYIGGLRRAGNIDWVGPDGERLSWYGPQVRAWYDGWVQPDKQFGKFVFMMGQPLLDVEKYIEESADSPSFDDRYVLGAALYKTGPASASLYVVHMELQPFPPEVPSPSAVGKFTSLVGGYGLPAGLYRYSLIMVADANGLPRYKVVPNSRQLLQSIPDVAREPWFFNKDATKAICLSQRAFSPLGVNDNRTFYYAYSRTPYNAGEQPSEGDPEWIDALTDPDDDTPYWFPQQTQTKIVLSIDHENEDAVTVANTMVTPARRSRWITTTKVTRFRSISGSQATAGSICCSGRTSSRSTSLSARTTSTRLPSGGCCMPTCATASSSCCVRTWSWRRHPVGGSRTWAEKARPWKCGRTACLRRRPIWRRAPTWSASSSFLPPARGAPSSSSWPLRTSAMSCA